MSENDLKSRLAAKVKAAQAEESRNQETAAKYHDVLLREYPRLCQELLDRVTALVGGVDGVTIDSEMKAETLKLPYGSTATGMKERVVGTVQVPTFSVAVAGVPMVTFRPAGAGIFGAHAAIDVETRKRSDNVRILMSSRKTEEEKWFLSVPNERRSFGAWFTELTDDVLSKMLEQALL